MVIHAADMHAQHRRQCAGHPRMTFLQTFAVAQDARKVLLTVTSNASASQSSAGHACTVCPAAGGAVRSRATCCGRPWSFHCFAAGPLLKPFAEICRSWVSAIACYKLKISMRLSQQCPPAAVVLLLCTIAASAGSAARACCYFFFVAAAPPAPCVL